MPNPLVGALISAHLVNPTGLAAWLLDGSILSALIAIASLILICLFAKLTIFIARCIKTTILFLVYQLYLLLLKMLPRDSPLGGDNHQNVGRDDRSEDELGAVMYRDEESGRLMLRVYKDGKVYVHCACNADPDSAFMPEHEGPCLAVSAPAPPVLRVSTQPLPPFAVRPIVTIYSVVKPKYPILTINIGKTSDNVLSYDYTGPVSSYRRRQFFLEETTTSPYRPSSGPSSMASPSDDEADSESSSNPFTPARAATAAASPVVTRQLSVGTALDLVVESIQEQCLDL